MSTESPTTDADAAARERKKTYKKSLNLPKTAFAMRANLHQAEPASLARWQEQDLYRRAVESGPAKASFVFHDGPPYANGDIHTGHLMNKVLKDIVVRSRNLLGERCAYVPGWDCHGLPIEHKVMAKMVASGKAEKLAGLDDDTRRMAIRRASRDYAAKFVKLQSRQLERLLTFADYRHPYLTMSPEVEQGMLEVLALLVEQGLVYRDLKPVHWSIANQTALAEAELEYHEREDPSVYVRFAVDDADRLATAFGVTPSVLEQPDDPVGASLLIWTTTPWTLPANMLIAVHPRHGYALVRFDGRAPTVVARSLVERVAAELGARVEVVAEAPGTALVGLGYRHPLRDWSDFDQHEGGHRGRVVEADYVTLEDGTGLVHTATGHGQDDYQTGQQEGAPVYCPVQGDGTYDDSVPPFLRGLGVWDANPRIVVALRDSGHLLYDAPYRHSYPHDWRSKTPVIFRCTEQWFIAIDRPLSRDGRSLRATALAAVEDEVAFVPAWGRNRMRGMLASRPDWCISRQRAWGLPIPAFRSSDGRVLLTAATVRAVGAVFATEGSDAWFTHSPASLLAGWNAAGDPDAPPDVDPAALEKMYDIIDVWFESGATWHAVMRQRGLGFPIDLYLEGSDQHRGWFQSSLLLSLAATGQPAMRTILTHGFGVDKDGRKMSKSLGNTLDVHDLLTDYGADVCRWWASSLSYESDIKVDRSFFDLAGEAYRKVRNTLRYLLSNLSDFDPTRDGVDLGSLDPASLDAHALAVTAELRQRVAAAYRRFAFRQAHRALFDFCNDTLSSFYLDAIKDRLYCDRPDSARRRASQSTMQAIAEVLIALLAPILPHTADEAWRILTGDDEGSVHLTKLRPLEAAADPGWPGVLAVRERVGKALEEAKAKGIENPLDAGVRVGDADGALAPFGAELPDAFGVSRVELTAEAAGVEVIDLRGEPRCERSWRRDPTVALRSDGGWLSERDADAVGVA